MERSRSGTALELDEEGDKDSWLRPGSSILNWIALLWPTRNWEAENRMVGAFLRRRIMRGDWYLQVKEWHY